MQRPIKFRAWNKVKKQMVMKANVMGANEPEIQEEWEFMQYTGLKDKNRVEIYEGDIVKHKVNGLWETDEIKWVTGSFVTGEWIPGDISLTRLHEPFEIEVIGNIYENKELLKGVKNGRKDNIG